MTQAPHFHLFQSLPYEIRRHIYILATPPRLVQVKEGFPITNKPCEVEHDEDSNSVDSPCSEYDDDDLDATALAFREFCCQLRHGSLRFDLKLHPDLTYFAENWRYRIDILRPIRRPRQSKLEEYGFTNTRPAYEPWHATPNSPRIQTDWLIENPELAFQLARQSWFYSTAAIPTFLHVCSESREALKAWGYQLAFGTRSHAQRTWFHFKRDILYIYRSNTDLPSFYHEPLDYLLTGCRWNIGQFDLVSLGSVERLILSEARWCQDIVQNIDSVTRLFPNLKELFLEDWTAQEVGIWLYDTHHQEVPEYDERRSIIDVCEPKVCISCEDIDTIGSICWFEYQIDADGIYREDLYSPGGSNQGTMPDILTYSNRVNRKEMAQAIAAQLNAQKKVPTSYYSSHPTIEYVHTCPESLSQRLLQGRHQFWQDFSSIQEANRRGHALELHNPSVKEPRFSLDVRRVDGECRRWRQLALSYGRYPGQLSSEDRQDRYALRRWYFVGPSISEPTTCPIN